MDQDTWKAPTILDEVALIEGILTKGGDNHSELKVILGHIWSLGVIPVLEI